jgi:HlyD family secretion protein
MTANVRILVAQHDQVLLVPNAAFRVRLDGAAPVQRSAARPAQSAATGRAGASRAPDTARQRVWVLEGGKPVARDVSTGLSDGERTEVLSGLREGETIIMGLGGNGRSGPAGPGGPRLRL